MAEACVVNTAKINTEAQEKPEETIELNISPVKAKDTQSNKPEVSNANSYAGKKVFKIVCVGDYSGGWSKGVYIEDYTSSDGTINENPRNFPVIGGSLSLKTLCDNTGQKIRIEIWNLPENERYFPTNRLFSKNSDGAIVFWGARSDTIECALKYKREITEVKSNIPVVLVVDNVFQTPARWFGHGLVINSLEEMDNFCLENGFFAWFEMLKRGAGEKSVFGEAMSALINEIIARNKDCQK